MDKFEDHLISDAYVKNLLIDGCSIRCGIGWEKPLTHFVEELIGLGAHPSSITSKSGAIAVTFYSGSIHTLSPNVRKSLSDMQGLLGRCCEFCWLGGRVEALNGRCERHRNWLN